MYKLNPAYNKHLKCVVFLYANSSRIEFFCRTAEEVFFKANAHLSLPIVQLLQSTFAASKGLSAHVETIDLASAGIDLSFTPPPPLPVRLQH